MTSDEVTPKQMVILRMLAAMTTSVELETAPRIADMVQAWHEQNEPDWVGWDQGAIFGALLRLQRRGLVARVDLDEPIGEGRGPVPVNLSIFKRGFRNHDGSCVGWRLTDRGTAIVVNGPTARTSFQHSLLRARSQRTSAALADALDSPEIASLVSDLEETRWTGRPGYPIRAMVGMCFVKSMYALRTWSRTARLVSDDAELQSVLGCVPSVWACYRFSTEHRHVLDAIDVTDAP